MKTIELNNGTITYKYSFGLSSNGDKFYNENGIELSYWPTQAGKFVLLKEKEHDGLITVEFVIIPNDNTEEQNFERTFSPAEYNRFCISILSGLIPADTFEPEA